LLREIAEGKVNTTQETSTLEEFSVLAKLHEDKE